MFPFPLRRVDANQANYQIYDDCRKSKYDQDFPEGNPLEVVLDAKHDKAYIDDDWKY